jgi:hypothetical protein
MTLSTLNLVLRSLCLDVLAWDTERASEVPSSKYKGQSSDFTKSYGFLIDRRFLKVRLVAGFSVAVAGVGVGFICSRMKSATA